MKLALVILSVALLPVLSVAQTMQLSSGSLQVLNGTTLTIEGPIEWVISPGSTVVNDGVIDLGTQAQLNEPVGGPVVGTGVERATHVGPGPFAGIEPGGLGAMLSTEDALNDLVVERGHAPYAHSGSVEGVARWYRIESTTMNGALELTRCALRTGPTKRKNGPLPRLEVPVNRGHCRHDPLAGRGRPAHRRVPGDARGVVGS